MKISMKVFLVFFVLFMGAFFAPPGIAQTPVYTWGSFNSSNIGGGTTVNVTAALPSPVTPWSSTLFPLYTASVTVTNTATDTMSQRIMGPITNGVYTWAHVDALTGTNTSCTLKLYASGDNGRGKDFKLLQTYTVSATGNPYDYTFNSGGNWTYTNIWWVFVGSGTQTSNFYCGLLARP